MAETGPSTTACIDDEADLNWVRQVRNQPEVPPSQEPAAPKITAVNNAVITKVDEAGLGEWKED